MFGFFHNKPIKIFDVAQVGIDPPHFQFHVNEPKGVHFSTKRYLENQLREDFDFAGVAIQCSYKKRR
jgi:GTP-binding protein